MPLINGLPHPRTNREPPEETLRSARWASADAAGAPCQPTNTFRIAMNFNKLLFPALVSLFSLLGFAQGANLGYCFTQSDSCHGTATTTITGDYPGNAGIAGCLSVSPSHHITKICTNSDCSSGCKDVDVRASSCAPQTKLYRCMVVVKDGNPPKPSQDVTGVKWYGGGDATEEGADDH